MISFKKLILRWWLFMAAGAALEAGTFKHITIDGSFDDWAGVPASYVDQSYQNDPAYQDDPGHYAGATDFKEIYVAHDDNYLYVRFTLYAPADPFTSHNNVFVDADNDPTTGFSAFGLLGSEMLIQSGSGYQEKNGTFNDGFAIDGLGWAAAPTGPGTDFEFRISRKATYDSDSLPVFASSSVAFVLEAENAQFATVDKLPVDQALVYSFDTAPPAATDMSLVSLTGASWQVNATGSDLGTAWREVDFDDTQTGWTSGSGLFGFTTNAGAYPAAIHTALPAGSTTCYLRTQFQWTSDTANVILVASNYLSDGAVFYLNGAELKRVRIPDGTVAFSTAATGGPTFKGQTELFALPADSLVVGTNVLAVELHQTAGDQSDLMFGLALSAAIDFPVVITDPTQPADRAVAAGDAVTFSATFIGNPPFSFQWYKDDTAISTGTNATFTIAPVLQGDIGGYSVKISNPFSSGVLTRSALLSVTNSPVTISDATVPADASVVEGNPVSFSIVVAGSAPITYQWFKGSTPVTGATNSILTIQEVLPTDAGDYHAVASNGYPSSVTSRTAHLAVSADTTAPTIVSVSGTAAQVSITFSEPMATNSASDVKNYTLSGGLTVTGAVQDPADPSHVTLATSTQALGTSYTLTINGLADRFGNPIAPNTQVHFLSTIVIDGSFDDWASVPLAFTDPSDTTDSLDYKDVYVASDDNYIYIRVTLYSAGDITDYHDNLFVDGDNDPTTGYSFAGIGSEILIQSGAGYQEKNGGFNEGGINGLDYAVAPAGAATDFEFRISRKATYANDGLPVFSTNSIAFALESENAGFVTKDIAPDTGGFAYTFPVSTAGGVLSIASSGGQLAVSWTGPGRLQSTDSLSSGNWQDVAGATNPYTVPVAGTQLFYRLIE